MYSIALSHISLKSACGRETNVNCNHLGKWHKLKSLKAFIHVFMVLYQTIRLTRLYLELCDCFVVISIDLVLHCAEVHGVLDDCGVPRGNDIRHWKCKEPIWVFPVTREETL